jgi:hypothetical protein
MTEKSHEAQQLKDAVVLVNRDSGEILNWKQSPKEILARAAEAAKALEDMIQQNERKPLIFGKERYLEYPHWQTIGKFFHCTAATEDAIFVEIGGHRGFKAKGYVIDERTGLVVGKAEAYCMDDEEKWSSRKKYEWHYVLDDGTTSAKEDRSRMVWEPNPEKPGGKRPKRTRVCVGEETVPLFQLASMAQTRAGAKSLANKFRYVAVLAGYEPTPAEEMVGTPATFVPVKAPVKAPQAKSAAPAEVAPPVAKPAATKPDDRITEEDQHKLFRALRQVGVPNDVMKRFMVKQFGFEKSAQLTKAQLAATLDWLAHFGKK